MNVATWKSEFAFALEPQVCMFQLKSKMPSETIDTHQKDRKQLKTAVAKFSQRPSANPLLNKS